MAQMKATGAAVQVATWKDHHDYRDEDVAWLAHAARRADHVVITQKDAVKLRDRWPSSVPEPLVAMLDSVGGRRRADRRRAGCRRDPRGAAVTHTRSVPDASMTIGDRSQPRPHPSRQGHVSRRGESVRGDDVAASTTRPSG